MSRLSLAQLRPAAFGEAAPYSSPAAPPGAYAPQPYMPPYMPGQPAPVPPTQELLSRESFGLEQKLKYLDLLMRADSAPTRNEPLFSGADIGASTDPVLFYQNKTRMPVGLRVVGDPLSNTVRLNFYRSNVGEDTFLDYLSNVGTVRNQTNQILVLPGAFVYVKNMTAGIPLDATDILRRLVVDLTGPLQAQNWLNLTP